MATDLSNLPSDPSVPKQQPQINNIKMESTPSYTNDLDVKPKMPPIMDQKQMNTMIGEINNAGQQGLTRLAEDIPRQTGHITQDVQSIPNNVPPPPQNTTPIDYIQNMATQEEIAQKINLQTNKKQTLDYFLDEIKIPLVISIIYMLFQYPILKKFLLSKFPTLFNELGSYTKTGNVVVSLLFGITYYLVIKVIEKYIH
jgi:hypothetical protein